MSPLSLIQGSFLYHFSLVFHDAVIFHVTTVNFDSLNLTSFQHNLLNIHVWWEVKGFHFSFLWCNTKVRILHRCVWPTLAVHMLQAKDPAHMHTWMLKDPLGSTHPDQETVSAESLRLQGTLRSCTVAWKATGSEGWARGEQSTSLFPGGTPGWHTL